MDPLTPASTSPAGYTPVTPTPANTSLPLYHNDDANAHTSENNTHGDSPDQPLKKKQRRNKPTLSCEECVERKTKCDRGRPHCLACIKRQTECRYAHVANVLEETNRSVSNSRRMTVPPKKKNILQNPSSGLATSPLEIIVPKARTLARARDSLTSSPGLLSHVPYSHPSASNVFGIGSEHPFANYWTCQGGLPEVTSVLPEKIQADILMERYFECMDAVYPMIHRQTFYADYEHFWSLPVVEKNKIDSDLVALIFAMLAIGTQFVVVQTPATKQTAEFYVSAGHQSLRISSYLNKTSIRSIQAMVLITYFLINDNHASDGWAFAGILIRQAYAMGLHRDPNIICPDATIFEKQQRRKLWQAVLLQDTFLIVLLALPPSATHTDVNVADLEDDSSSIAPSSPTDIAYIRGCWSLANLVQETICSPRSLSLPIATIPRQKSALLSSFKAVYRSFPDIFRSWDAASLTSLSQTNKRIVRQTLFLTSNYWHNVMLLHASESKEVPMSVRGTLEAAHEAIGSFFLLRAIFGQEAGVWWVFNHRAFLEAMCIGNVLKEHGPGAASTGTTGIQNGDQGTPGGSGATNGADAAAQPAARDPLFVRAKADLVKMIDIMREMSLSEQTSAEVAKTRVAVLTAYLDN